MISKIEFFPIRENSQNKRRLCFVDEDSIAYLLRYLLLWLPSLDEMSHHRIIALVGIDDNLTEREFEIIEMIISMTIILIVIMIMTMITIDESIQDKVHRFYWINIVGCELQRD